MLTEGPWTSDHKTLQSNAVLQKPSQTAKIQPVLDRADQSGLADSDSYGSMSAVGRNRPADRRPDASLDSGQVAACEERRIGYCNIGAGQLEGGRHRDASVRQQREARIRAGKVLHSGTVSQRGGIPTNMR